MKKYDRGERRFQRERVRTNRKGHYGGIKNRFEGSSLEGKDLERAKQRVLGIWARTSTVCSCYMCGNPRRSVWFSNNRFGRASKMQERKAFLFFCVKEE